MKIRLLLVFVLFLIPLAANAADLALGGNCAVCLIEAGKVVPGSDKHAVTFDRQVYQFPSAKEKEIFAANPVKYAPALAGDCVVCLGNMGVRMPGKAEFAIVHDKRAYLFPSAKERDVFKADPKKYATVDIANGGNCVVCLKMAKKEMPGKSEIVSVYDGMQYFFPSTDEKKVFDADPAKFVPALDGNCVVCFKDAGKRIVGSPKFSATHEGRIYLFPEEGMQKKFLADPKKYSTVDIANGGNCVVCLKMAKKEMPGKAEFTSVFKGKRYLFPSAKERTLFDNNPASFIPKDMKVGVVPTVKPEALSVTGKAACAGCVYGVRPISDADSLGIAVVAGDKVYVVEGGEKRYPDLFKARFDSPVVELNGAVMKTEGKFVWVEPTSLNRMR